MYNNKEVATTDLIAANGVDKKSFFQTVYRSLNKVFNLFMTKFF